MKTLKSFILLFIFIFVIWILLTNTDPQELIAGAIISLIICIILSRYSQIFSEITLSPKSFLYIFLYIFIFISELIKANLDVAQRVVNPNLPINPGIVKVKTKLKSKIGRIILANSITLTPGTLTVETYGDYFYIHWIDVTSETIEENTEKIVRKFETYLEVIFG